MLDPVTRVPLVPSDPVSGGSLVLPKIAGECIDCCRFNNIIQQGPWQGFCFSCAAEARELLEQLERDDAVQGR